MFCSALAIWIVRAICSRDTPKVAKRSGRISTCSSSRRPSTIKLWLVLATPRNSCRTSKPNRRKEASSTSFDHSVTVTTGTSSTPLGLTSGSLAPRGIASRLELSLSYNLTSEGSNSSPTLNCTVTRASPRIEAE